MNLHRKISKNIHKRVLKIESFTTFSMRLFIVFTPFPSYLLFYFEHNLIHNSLFLIETPAEQVYRKLTFANIEELNDTIQRERERFM